MTTLKVMDVDDEGNSEVIDVKIPKQRVYVAGKMRGIAEFNFPAFFAAEAFLVSEGYEVFNPARRDIDKGFTAKGMTGNEDLKALGFCLRDALAADLKFITESADIVVVLDGWQTSSGARAEVATARALGIPVQDLEGNVVTDQIVAVPQ